VIEESKEKLSYVNVCRSVLSVVYHGRVVV